MLSRQLVLRTNFIIAPLGSISVAMVCIFGLAVDLSAQQFIQQPVNSSPSAASSIPGQTIEPISTVPVMPPPVIPQSQIALPPVSQPGFVTGNIMPENAPAKTRSDLPTAVSKPVEPSQITDEINSIRKQLGGGLSSQFGLMKDLDPQWQKSLEESFQNEIVRLAGEQAPQTESKTNQNDVDTQNTIGSTERAVSNSPPAVSLGANGRWTLPKSPKLLRPVDQLRDAASALDQMAGQFETSRLYEEADQIRAQAQRLWLKSRQYQSSQSPAQIHRGLSQGLVPDLSGYNR